MLKSVFSLLVKKDGTNSTKGVYGEKLALKHLRRKGYKLVEKNYRAVKCEIDIIMQQRNTIVFVEVKTRAAVSIYGTAAEAVDMRKQNNIKKAAQAFLNSKKLNNVNARFDVVEVYLDSNTVNHIENAFY